ncbi:unnamed protein product [Trypanosoma congolense IL3000]|uniref:WGS project CAEQ00000000 data, annotated contig 2351 n=1 Tax=Trypanosoma congolense (strain IL3000) TaxID=1068625 RepID=F9WDC0_TRYCI|nr:unnamed protein product [Trypanosoma congolense IL3000]
MVGTSRSYTTEDEYTAPAQRGVLFFSTVPRDMRPYEVLSHFDRFGTITRHKFTPFPGEHRTKGSARPLQFMRGYVEFAHAEDARCAAAAMNGTPVDCKRRRRCDGQLWTVKYEEGFTWDVLLEEREAAVRSKRQREVDARSHERAMNEAFRAAVLGRMAGRHGGVAGGKLKEETVNSSNGNGDGSAGMRACGKGSGRKAAAQRDDEQSQFRTKATSKSESGAGVTARKHQMKKQRAER